MRLNKKSRIQSPHLSAESRTYTPRVYVLYELIPIAYPFPDPIDTDVALGLQAMEIDINGRSIFNVSEIPSKSLILFAVVTMKPALMPAPAPAIITGPS